jgi:hypothetical protein
LGAGYVPAGDAFFGHRGPVATNISNYANVVESSDAVIDKEALLKAGVEHGEVIVASDLARGSRGAGVEGIAIYPMAGVDTALNGRDAVLELVPDVGTGLSNAETIDIGDGVVVGVGGVKLDPALEMGVAVTVVIVLGSALPRNRISGECSSGWWNGNGVWAGEDTGGRHGGEGVDEVRGKDNVEAA